MKELASTELADFLRFCRSERRLAAMTCSAYERDVSACLGYLQGEGIEELAEVKVAHLRAFLASEQNTRPAASSQARTTAALKLFFRFLVEEERLVRDPALPLRTPKKREALPDVLTMSELERLLMVTGRAEVWERHFHGKSERDRLLLALLAYAGLRRSELLGLDCNTSGAVRKAKGGARTSRSTRARLTDCRVLRGPPAGCRAGALRQRARRASPGHHVFASELLHAGANLRQTQELLGHKHLDSMQRYTRVNAHELRGAIKCLRWVGDRPLRSAPSEP